MSKRTLRYLLVSLIVLSLLLPVVAQMAPKGGAPAVPAPTTQADPNRVVITIGSEKITAQQFEQFVADLPPDVQQMARGPHKRAVAEELVKIKVLGAEAGRRGLENSPKFQRQMDVLKAQALTAALFDQVQNDVNEQDLQKLYDEQKSRFEQVKARHILIRFKGSRVPLAAGKKELTEDEAKAAAEGLRKRIAGGEDFATLARSESDDRGTALMGGDLGYFRRGRMVKAFEDAAFALKVGEMSNAVRSDYGYHVIQVQEHKTPTLEEVKPELKERAGPERMEKLYEDLKKAANPTLDESFFGPTRRMMPSMPSGHPDVGGGRGGLPPGHP